jgi:AcrR family transcriptional regulator
MARQPATARASAETPTPPEGPKLTDVVIVQAAREIVAESGVDGLTMRDLSTKLGVALGATYHHVPTRHDLVKLVCADVYREVPTPSPDGDWAQQMKSMMLASDRAVRGYPGLSAYMMSHADDMTPVALNRAMRTVLGDAGFSAHSISVVLSALTSFGNGMAANRESLRAGAARAKVDIDQLYEDGLDMLLAGARELLSADREAR